MYGSEASAGFTRLTAVGEDLTDAESAIQALRPFLTKISLPLCASGTVRRDAFEAVLDAGARVTSVIGAAGFGKTTSVALWASRQHAPVAWYTIDSYDNRPSVFWRHVAAAIAQARPTVSAHGTDDDPLSDCYEVAGLLAALGPDPDPMVVVLDDAHLVEDATILEQLAYAVERAPAALRFVFVARLRPQLPWGRWAVRQYLAEVPELLLAMNESQSAELLRTMSRCELSDDVVGRLNDAAGGWPAMLSLIGHILSHRDRPADSLSSSLAQNHLVLDYVVNEVLGRLTGTDREAAMAMSLLDELDPRRCELLCGVPDGRKLLRDLARQGIPMVLLDPVADAWRFHSLVRAVLLAELGRAHGGDLGAAHAQAAEVERAVDNSPAAVRHLIAAGDTDRAFDIVFAPLGEMYRSGSVQAMAHWIDLFPPDFVAASAERSATFALAMAFLGRREELERWVRHNEAHDTTPSTELDLALTKPRLLEALDRGDTAMVREELAALQERQGADVLERTHDSHVTVIMAIASVVDDRPDEAVHWADAIVRWPDIPERIRAVGQPTRAAWAAYLQGSLERAARIARSALDAGGEVGNIALHAQVELYALQAALALERFDLDDADYWAARTCGLTEPMHPCLHRYIADRVAFSVLEARQGPEAASAAASAAARSATPPVAVRYQVLAAEFDARAGRSVVTTRRLASLPASARRSMVAARLASRNGNIEAVEAQLRDLAGFGVVPRALSIEADLLRARVNPGSDALARALEAGAADGYVWTYRREGQALDEALNLLLEIGGRWQDTELAQSHRSPAAAPATVGRLSEGELRVLRLLASHRSQVEIADELVVSVNTVKTQVRHVYRKLGVTLRSDAVNRARELGLLDGR